MASADKQATTTTVVQQRQQHSKDIKDIKATLDPRNGDSGLTILQVDKMRTSLWMEGAMMATLFWAVILFVYVIAYSAAKIGLKCTQ